MFVNLLTLTVPLYMMQVFDRVLGSGSVDTLIMLSIAAAGALITLSVLDYIRSATLLHVSAALRRHCGGPILKDGIGLSVQQHPRDAAACQKDFANLCGIVGSHSVVDMLDVPWTLIFIGVLFLIDPLIDWIGAAGALVLFLLGVLAELSTRGGRSHRAEAGREADAIADYAIDNAEALLAMGMAPAAVDRWQTRELSSADLFARNDRRSAAIVAASRFFRFGFQVAVLGAGALLVLDKSVSPGAMMAGAIIMSRALAPMERVISSWKVYVHGRDIYSRLRNAFAQRDDDGAYTPLPEPVGRLVVENATYFYPGSDEPTLRGLHLRVEPGEIVAAIGPTGAGKSSLARLAAGVLPPRTGHARLGGVSLSDWHPDDRGKYVGYVPQRVGLLDATIAENISRLTDVSAETVIEAAELAGFHETILSLPGAYDFEIRNGGANLPGGIRQQIALAQALFGKPRLVVLDEPSNNLDQFALARLQQSLRRIADDGAAVLLVTHNPALLHGADRAFEMRQGAIRRVGAPLEFLQTAPPVSTPTRSPTPKLETVR